MQHKEAMDSLYTKILCFFLDGCTVSFLYYSI